MHVIGFATLHVELTDSLSQNFHIIPKIQTSFNHLQMPQLAPSMEKWMFIFSACQAEQHFSSLVLMQMEGKIIPWSACQIHLIRAFGYMMLEGGN
jgi:hypothetical protein